MQENKIMDKVQRDLIRKYHAVAHEAGLGEAEKRAILESYGVTSSRDLSQHQLIDVIAGISSKMDEHKDRLRKRLIAAVGRYLRTIGYNENIITIKSVVEQAAGCPFNRIPPERIRSLIFAFNNKVKDLERVDEITKEVLKLKRNE
jgi:hypothetical protein